MAIADPKVNKALEDAIKRADNKKNTGSDAGANTVDKYGRTTYVKPGHEGWSIDTGKPVRSNAPRSAPAFATPPSDAKKVTYGLGKAGISTVVNLGKNPSPAAQKAAEAMLRKNKPKTTPKPAITTPTMPHAKAPEEPPMYHLPESSKNPEAKPTSQSFPTPSTGTLLKLAGTIAVAGTALAGAKKVASGFRAARSAKSGADAEVEAAKKAVTRNRSPQVEAARNRLPQEAEDFIKAEPVKVYPRRPSSTQNVKVAVEAAERADQRARFQPPAPKPAPAPVESEAPKIETPKVTIPDWVKDPKLIEQYEIQASRAAIGQKREAPPEAPATTAAKAPETPAAPKQVEPAKPSTPEAEIAAAQRAVKPPPAPKVEPPDTTERPATTVVGKVVQKVRNRKRGKPPAPAVETPEVETPAVADAAKIAPKAPTPPPAPPVSNETRDAAQRRIDQAADHEARQKAYVEAREAARSGDKARMQKALEGLPAGTKKTETWTKNLQDLIGSSEAPAAPAAPAAPKPATAPVATETKKTPEEAKAAQAADHAARSAAYDEARAAARSADPVRMQRALTGLPEGTKKTATWTKILEDGIQKAAGQTTPMDAADSAAVAPAAPTTKVEEAPKAVQDTVKQIDTAQANQTDADLHAQLEAARAENRALGGSEAAKEKPKDRYEGRDVKKTPGRFRLPKQQKPEAPAPPTPAAGEMPEPWTGTERREEDRRSPDQGTRRDNASRMTQRQSEKAFPNREPNEAGVTHGQKRTSRRERGSDNRVKQVPPPTPTVDEVAGMKPAERAALVEQTQQKIADIEKELTERRIAEATGPEDIAQALAASDTRAAKVRQASNQKWKEEEAKRIAARQAGLDPDTMRPLNPNVVLSSTAAETPESNTYTGIAETEGQKRGEKQAESVAEKARQKAQEQIASGKREKTKPAVIPGNEKDTRPLHERAGLTPEELEAKVTVLPPSVPLEDKIPAVTSGQNPETSREVRHASTQMTLEEANRQIAQMERDLSAAKKRETEVRAANKRKAAEKETAKKATEAEDIERFSPGGANVAEQLANPINNDVKSINRVVRDPVTGEMRMQTVTGSELEDLRRASEDRRQIPERRSQFGSAIADIITEDTDRRTGERRGDQRRGAAPGTAASNQNLEAQANKILRDAGYSEDVMERDLYTADTAVLTPEQAEIIRQRMTLDDARQAADEAMAELQKQAAENEAKLDAKQRPYSLPYDPEDVRMFPRVQEHPAYGEWRAPTSAGELIEQSQRNIRTNLSRARAFGAAGEERTTRDRRFGVERRVQDVPITVLPGNVERGEFAEDERRGERRSPENKLKSAGARAGAEPRRGSVPILSAEDWDKILKPYEEAPNTDQRRPAQFEDIPKGGKKARRAEILRRFMNRLGPQTGQITNPSVGMNVSNEATVKPEMEAAKAGEPGVKVRGKGIGGGRTAAIAAAVFAGLGATKAGAEEYYKTGDWTKTTQAFGKEYAKELPAVAGELAKFTAADVALTKAMPALAEGTARAAGNALARRTAQASAGRAVANAVLRAAPKLGARVGMLGTGLVAGVILPGAIEGAKNLGRLAMIPGENARAKQEAEHNKIEQERKYGTVERATRTRHGLNPDTGQPMSDQETDDLLTWMHQNHEKINSPEYKAQQEKERVADERRRKVVGAIGKGYNKYKEVAAKLLFD